MTECPLLPHVLVEHRRSSVQSLRRGVGDVCEQFSGRQLPGGGAFGVVISDEIRDRAVEPHAHAQAGILR